MPSRTGGKLRASPLRHPRGFCMNRFLLILTLLGFTASAQAQDLRIGMRDERDAASDSLEAQLKRKAEGRVPGKALNKRAAEKYGRS